MSAGMPERHPVPYVRADGGRFEIGHAHGTAVRDLVHGTLAWSLGQLSASGVDRDEGLRRAADLLRTVEQHTPELAEEVRGIAAGAGLRDDEIALINARYELLFTGGDRSRAGRPEEGRRAVPGAECTLFGVAGDRTGAGPIIGQNVDLGPESRPLWILLDVRPTGGPRVLTATLAGMLAQEGINSYGLALCGSMVRSAGWRGGYPTRKFLRRKVLEQPTVEAGIGVIRGMPGRASSHNLLLADADGRVADVETTVDEVFVLEPEAGVLAHSNHYLAPGATEHNPLLDWYLPNTQARCARARELLEGAQDPVTVADVQEMLRDHSGGNRAICRHATRDESGAETNVAVVAEPTRRRLHLAFGPPCEAEFFTYSLEPESPPAWSRSRPRP